MVTHPKFSQASTLMPYGSLSIWIHGNWRGKSVFSASFWMQTMMIRPILFYFSITATLHCICRPMAFVDHIVWTTLHSWKSKTNWFVYGLIVSLLLEIHRGNRNHHLSHIRITFFVPVILFDYIFFLLWRLIWCFSFLPPLQLFATLIVAFIEPSF